MGHIGPGPGAYGLPATVGYTKHDPSRFRNPQYTMAYKYLYCGKAIGPGPTYQIANMTRYGKAGAPAYSLASRNKELTKFATPGPGAHSIAYGRVNPCYTMSSRNPALARAQTPGPNQYSCPSSIGPKVPDKPASAAYSLVGNHKLGEKFKSPGPATYGGIPVDNYKIKNPKFTMRPRADFQVVTVNPGPAAYLPKVPKSCSAGYSFGNRTIGAPYITADDVIPCTRKQRH